MSFDVQAGEHLAGPVAACVELRLGHLHDQAEEVDEQDLTRLKCEHEVAPLDLKGLESPQVDSVGLLVPLCDVGEPHAVGRMAHEVCQALNKLTDRLTAHLLLLVRTRVGCCEWNKLP